jgi:2-polyprenyl-3-methyl-5-hydroxy-6-metoxy-1,4-benzoquinol methylase
MAFGVDPKRPHRYNLRQSRYDALAHDIDVLAGKAALAGQRLAVLDIGCGKGAAAMHLRARPNFGAIDIDATDIGVKYELDTGLYRSVMYGGDLTKGYPELPTGSYDVIICEQVLEHLLDLEIPMATISRLVKPGGRAFVGVPVFLAPLHLARRHVVPILDRLVGYKGKRTHVQAFTLASFKATLLAHTKMRFIGARGFRVISGGPFRPLEELRWWWAFNRWLGEKLPAACVEVQIILEKPVSEYSEDPSRAEPVWKIGEPERLNACVQVTKETE